MTAAARQVRTSHWADTATAANEPRYPTYPQIRTGKDMFIALAAWAVGPIVVIGAVALVFIFKH